MRFFRVKLRVLRFFPRASPLVRNFSARPVLCRWSHERPRESSAFHQAVGQLAQRPLVERLAEGARRQRGNFHHHGLILRRQRRWTTRARPRAQSRQSILVLYRRIRMRTYSSMQRQSRRDSWTRIPWALSDFSCPRRMCTALRYRFSHRPNSFDSAAFGARTWRHIGKTSRRIQHMSP